MSAVHPDVGHGGLGDFHDREAGFMVERRSQLKASGKSKRSPFTKVHCLFRHYPIGFIPPALCDIGLWGTLSPKVVFHHWSSVRCEENPRCRWFTYDERAQLCYLKSGRGFQRSRCKQKNNESQFGFKNLEKNVLYQTPHDLGLMGS